MVVISEQTNQQIQRYFEAGLNKVLGAALAEEKDVPNGHDSARVLQSEITLLKRYLALIQEVDDEELERLYSRMGDLELQLAKQVLLTQSKEAELLAAQERHKAAFDAQLAKQVLLTQSKEAELLAAQEHHKAAFDAQLAKQVLLTQSKEAELLAAQERHKVAVLELHARLKLPDALENIEGNYGGDAVVRDKRKATKRRDTAEGKASKRLKGAQPAQPEERTLTAKLPESVQLEAAAGRTDADPGLTREPQQQEVPPPPGEPDKEKQPEELPPMPPDSPPPPAPNVAESLALVQAPDENVPVLNAEALRMSRMVDRVDSLLPSLQMLAGLAPALSQLMPQLTALSQSNQARSEPSTGPEPKQTAPQLPPELPPPAPAAPAPAVQPYVPSAPLPNVVTPENALSLLLLSIRQQQTGAPQAPPPPQPLISAAPVVSPVQSSPAQPVNPATQTPPVPSAPQALQSQRFGSTPEPIGTEVPNLANRPEGPAHDSTQNKSPSRAFGSYQGINLMTKAAESAPPSQPALLPRPFRREIRQNSPASPESVSPGVTPPAPPSPVSPAEPAESPTEDLTGRTQQLPLNQAQRDSTSPVEASTADNPDSAPKAQALPEHQTSRWGKAIREIPKTDKTESSGRPDRGRETALQLRARAASPDDRSPSQERGSFFHKEIFGRRPKYGSSTDLPWKPRSADGSPRERNQSQFDGLKQLGSHSSTPVQHYPFKFGQQASGAQDTERSVHLFGATQSQSQQGNREKGGAFSQPGFGSPLTPNLPPITPAGGRPHTAPGPQSPQPNSAGSHREPFGSFGSRSRHGSPGSSSRPFSAGRGQRPRSGGGPEPRPGRMGYNVRMAPPGVPLTRLDNLIMYGEIDPQWRAYQLRCELCCLGFHTLTQLKDHLASQDHIQFGKRIMGTFLGRNLDLSRKQQVQNQRELSCFPHNNRRSLPDREKGQLAVIWNCPVCIKKFNLADFIRHQWTNPHLSKC